MTDYRYARSIATLPSVPIGMSHMLPNEPGLYIAAVSDIQGHAFVGYVGVTSISLYQRWAGHRGAKGKASQLIHLANRISLPGGPAYVLIYYDILFDIDALYQNEEQVIQAWNPPLNSPRRGEGGTPLLITPNTTMIGGTRDRMPVYVSPDQPPDWSIDCHIPIRRKHA